MRSVGVVIVNWNGGDLAVESVRSALAQQGVAVSVFVVDNASADGSADRIAALGPSVTVIRNTENRVFAAANNQAIPLAAELDFVLLLNNDAILPEPDGLARAVASIDGQGAQAAACGRFEYPDGEFQRFYNGLPGLTALLTVFGIARYVAPLRSGRAVRRFMMEDADFTREMTIEQPAFACVLLRADACREVGLLDERFPLFFNDVDYCRRWRAAGYAIRYLPGWRVVHHQSRSTGRLGGARAAELLSSVVRYARKHHGVFGGALLALSSFLDASIRARREGRMPLSPLAIARGRSLFDQVGPASAAGDRPASSRMPARAGSASAIAATPAADPTAGSLGAPRRHP